MLFLEKNIFSRVKKEKAQIHIDQGAYKKKKRKKKKFKKKPRLRKGAVAFKTSEGKLIKGLEKTISFLEKTVNKLEKKSDKRLRMLDRIIILLSEQASYVSNQEYLTYDKKWIEWDKSGRKGKEPKLVNKSSLRYWKSLLRYTKIVLNEYDKGKVLSNISFLRANAYEILGEEKKSIKAFKDLIQSFPSSQAAGKSHYFLGEYYFDKGDFPKAQFHYNSVLKFKRSLFYGWSFFKLGWCSYNYEDYEKALSYWKKTVKFARKLSGGEGDQLREEALRDIVFSYTELGAVDAGLAYFRKNGGAKYAIRFLRTIGSNYADNGEIEEALSVWTSLLEIYPNSVEAFATQKDIIEVYFDDELYHKVWKELDTLGKRYSSKSSWVKENESKAIDEALKKRKKAFLFFPKKVHSYAQKRKKKELPLQAKKGYFLFLKYYKNSKEEAEIREYLADIEYEQGHFKIAGDLYKNIALLPKEKAVVFNSSGKVIKSIRKRTAKNMLDSYSRIFVPQLKEMMKFKPDYKKEAKAVSPEAKDFIEACQIYTKIFPKDNKKKKECDVFLAETYYRFRDKEQAKTSLWHVAKNYSHLQEGSLAVEYLIPLYSDNEGELVKIAKKILAIKVYSEGPLGEKIRALLRQMRIARIEAINDSYKRAEKYVSEATKKPKDPDVDKFWYNSAVSYLKAKRLVKAINSFKKVTKNYPYSKGYLPSLLQLGKIYESMMDLSKASLYYLTYANKAPKGNDLITSYQKACLLMIAMDHPRAYQESLSFTNQYPKYSQLILERLIRNLEIKKEKNLLEKVIYKFYFRYFPIKGDKKILMYWKLYKLYSKNIKKRKVIAEKILISFKKSGGAGGEALRNIGEIVFQSLQSDFQNSLKHLLKGGTVKNLQISIERIQKVLVILEKKYEKLFATQDSYWSIAGFYQLGYAYEMFAKQLRKPPEIKGVKRDLVKKELKSSVTVIVKKVQGFYTNGLQVVRRFLIYSEWSNKIFNAVNRSYLRNISFEEWVVEPDYLGSEIAQNLSLKLRD